MGFLAHTFTCTSGGIVLYKFSLPLFIDWVAFNITCVGNIVLFLTVLIATLSLLVWEDRI